MSVKAMGLVWEANLDRQLKLVLLAYADHADHDGDNIFPSVGRIAWKTGYHPDSIRRLTKSLIDLEILVSDGESQLGTNLYHIDYNNLPNLEPYQGTGKRGRPSNNPRTLRGLSENNPRKGRNNPRKNENNPRKVIRADPSLNPSLKKEEIKELKDTTWIRFLELWKELFPNKPQPRKDNQKLRDKVRSRIKEQQFLDYWQEALRRASESPTCQKKSWFHVEFFLRNSENYMNCYDRWQTWQDEQITCLPEGGDNKRNFSQERRIEEERVEQERLRKQGQPT